MTQPHPADSDAFNQGYEGFWNNEEISHNPYEFDDRRYEAWVKGWNLAEEEFFRGQISVPDWPGRI